MINKSATWLKMCIGLLGIVSTGLVPIESRTVEIIVPQVEQAPTIDGVLDDAAWKSAAEAKDFLDVKTGKPAQNQTAVKVMTTAHGLCFGATLFDPDPTRLVGQPATNNPSLANDDHFEIRLYHPRQEQKYFSFIVNPCGAREAFQGSNGTPWKAAPDWQAGVSRDGKAWHVEVFVPFDTLGLRQPGGGNGRPGRGDVWRLGLYRCDRQHDPSGGTRVISSWVMPAERSNLSGAQGDLVFLSRQILENGGMEIESERKGVPYAWDQGWKNAEKDPALLADAQKIEGALDPEIKVEGKTSARFKAQAGGHVAALLQHFSTIPGQTYRLSAKIKIEGLTARTGGAYLQVHSDAEDGRQIVLKIPPGAEGFNEYAITFTGAKSGRCSCHLLFWKSPCTVWVDDVRVEPVGRPLAPDELCLTGNFQGDPARNRQIPGTYSVFNGNTTSYDAHAFAMKASGATAVIDHMLEEWLFCNVVPFDKGQLTNGKSGDLNFLAPGNAQYQFQLFWVNRSIGGTVLFDLKKEYALTRIKVRPSRVKNDHPYLHTELYLKTEDGRLFTNVGRQNGYGTALFEGLNMRARWVAVTARAEGLNQIEIWGREDLSKARSPVPYEWPAAEKHEDKSKTNEPAVVFTDVGIYPQPREVKALNSAFLVKQDTPLVLVGEKPSERSRTTLQTFQSDLADETGVMLVTQEIASATAPVALRLSVRGQSPELEAQLAKQVGTVVTNEQGYTLLVDPKTGIWLTGADEAGLFYGTRALLDLLKKQDNGLSAQAVAIRDWPRATLRGIMYTPEPGPFNDRFIRHIARLRYNTLPWSAKADQFVEKNGTNVTRQLIAHCDRYFIQVIPSLCCVARGKGMTQEKRADEPAPTGTRCAMCISDEGNRKEYLRLLSTYAPFYNSKYFMIGLDEIDHTDQGSRWNCCPQCLARKMTTQELYAEWIKKVCAHLRSLGKTPMCSASPWFEPSFKGLDLLVKDDIPVMITYVSTKDRRQAIKALGCHGYIQYDAGVRPLMDNEIGGYIANWGGQTPESLAGQGKFAMYVRLANGFWAASLPPPDEYEDEVGRAMARLRAAVNGFPESSLASKPADFLPLDLSKQANEPLKDELAGDGHGWMDEGPGRDLRALPQGKQTFVDIPFLIGDKCLIIENRARLGRILPESISISIDRKLAGLVFIHTQNQTCDQSQTWFCNMTYLGHYLIHYEDNTFAVHPLRYSVNIKKWGTEDRHSYQATVAWRGQTSLGYPVTLYLDEWANPYPEKKITRIEFCATKQPRPTRLALVAATAILARDYNTQVSTNRPTPWNELQRPALPNGLKLIPVMGGTYEVELGKLFGGGIPFYNSVRYTAPNGIVFSSSNTWSRSGEPHLTQALVDNNWYWEAKDRTALTVTFPAPRALKALEIIGCYENRRNAGLRNQDFEIETSPDGTAFVKAAEIKQTTAEVDGRIPVVLSGQPIKALRITPIRRNDYKYGTVGLAYLAMYE